MSYSTQSLKIGVRTVLNVKVDGEPATGTITISDVDSTSGDYPIVSQGNSASFTPETDRLTVRYSEEGQTLETDIQTTASYGTGEGGFPLATAIGVVVIVVAAVVAGMRYGLLGGLRKKIGSGGGSEEI